MLESLVPGFIRIDFRVDSSRLLFEFQYLTSDVELSTPAVGSSVSWTAIHECFGCHWTCSGDQLFYWVRCSRRKHVQWTQYWDLHSITVPCEIGLRVVTDISRPRNFVSQSTRNFNRINRTVENADHQTPDRALAQGLGHPTARIPGCMYTWNFRMTLLQRVVVSHDWIVGNGTWSAFHDIIQKDLNYYDIDKLYPFIKMPQYPNSGIDRTN